MQNNYPRQIDGMIASIIVAIMDAVKSPADAGTVYSGLCEKFDAIIKLCEVERFSVEIAHELLYPLAAFADESLMSVPQYRSYWITNPLQLRYYKEMDAGTAFFSRLKKIVADPKDKERLLELYFICLAMGFKGMYRSGSEDELRVIFEDAGNALSDARKKGIGGSGLTGYGNARKRLFTLRRFLCASFLLLTIVAAIIYLSSFVGFLEFLGGIL